MNDPTAAPCESRESVLACLCEEISDRLRCHEHVDFAEYLDRWPQYADELRELLPAIQWMAEIGSDPEARSATPSVEPVANESLGDFRIVREVGRGGMGVVYEAEQLSLRRKVALKVLPLAAVLDHRQLRRFHNEAQAAALLHHPQIVPVYGVGCERGVHYYAMQLIEGPTLAQVIRDLRTRVGLSPPPEPTVTTPRLTGASVAHAQVPAKTTKASDDSDTAQVVESLSASKSTGPQGILSTAQSHRSPSFVQAAIQLGIEVAEALDYAHQEGVLHRDIKPGNLMLDARGKVWVADFGLARIEADPGMTLTGDLIGTLRYMSPEQALAKRVTIDGRSDVYSLGATLYELLTLEPVFDGDDRQAILRQIAFDEPRPLRQLDRSLPVELETILLKTLAKNPEERYATAGAMADDLRRFLEQKPIQARRPTLMDRATKWALRNRRLVAASAAGLLLTAVTMAVASLLIWNEQQRTVHALEIAVRERAEAQRQRQQAQVARQQADEQSAIARAVNEFLQHDLLGMADAQVQIASGMELDPDVKVRTLLDRASQAIEGKFPDQPLLEAEIRQTIGATYEALGVFTEAEVHLECSLKNRQQWLGKTHPDTLDNMGWLARIYAKSEQRDRALPLFEETLQLMKDHLGPHHLSTLHTMHELAHTVFHNGQQAEGLALHEEVLRLEQKALGREDPESIRTLRCLGRAYADAGQPDKGRPLCAEALELLRAKLGPNHPATLTAMSDLAATYIASDQAITALPILEELLELRRKTHGLDHRGTVMDMGHLALAYGQAGQLDKALPLAEETLKLSKTSLGPQDPLTLSSMYYLAITYRNAGKLELALPLAEESFKMERATRGRDHPNTLRTMGHLGRVYVDAGKLDLALPLFEEALELTKAKLGPEHPDTLNSMCNLAVIYEMTRKLELALALLEESLRLATAQFGPEHPTTIGIMDYLAGAYLDAGKRDLALPLLRELLATSRKSQSNDSPQLAGQIALLSFALLQSNAFSDAEPLLRECLAIREKSQPDVWSTFSTQSLLGGALLGQQKFVDAEPLLLAGYEGMKQKEDQIPAECKVRLVEALERLVQLYEALEKPDEAAKWRREIEATKQRIAPPAN